MLLVALAAFVAATWGAYAGLLVAAVLSGFGYALSNVGTNVAVARAVVPRRRSVALAAKTAGVPAVGVLSAAVGPWVSDRWRWEWVLVLIGAGAAAIAVVASRVLPDDRPERGERAVVVNRGLPRHFGWFRSRRF